MRKYVEERGYGHILTKLYGVYDNPREINFDVLPDSFGKVICCLLVIGRGKDAKLMLTDRCFHRLEYINETDSFKEYSGDDYSKYRPKSYDEMWDIASGLSTEFPFVRVDLYDSNGHIFFGELTFSPHGCIHDYFTRKGNCWIGSKILYP